MGGTNTALGLAEMMEVASHSLGFGETNEERSRLRARLDAIPADAPEQIAALKVEVAEIAKERDWADHEIEAVQVWFEGEIDKGDRDLFAARAQAEKLAKALELYGHGPCALHPYDPTTDVCMTCDQEHGCKTLAEYRKGLE